MNKGISPVVAMALLVVVAVVGVIGFQLWNEAFQSSQVTISEKEAERLPYDFTIDSIRGELMYVYSNRNQTFSNVTIAGVACNISTNLTIGLNRLNISSCVQTGMINEVVYVLDNNEFGARSIFPKDSITLSVSTGNLTVSVLYWLNITDPTASSDSLSDIAIDTNDNVYVTGYCTGCGISGGQAIYTMKFNNTGGHQWTNITDPTAFNDVGYDIATDTNNDVYITGQCYGCGAVGNEAIYTLKFDTNGVHQWTNITDISAIDDRGEAIATDSSNNVYITGSCNGCGPNGALAMYTMKFDTNGVHQWTNITDEAAANDVGYDIAVDSSDNIYIAGSCNSCGNNGGAALHTLKFDENGNFLWNNITDPTGGGDQAYGVAVDSNNDVYVTGICNSCGNVGHTALYTMKFNSTGSHQWTNITDPTADLGFGESGEAITVDSSDNVYVTGYCYSCGPTGNYAIYTMKFDNSGNHQWTNITDPTASLDFSRGIVIDSNDNPYIGAFCSGCGDAGSSAFYTYNLNGDTGVAD